MSLRFVSAIAYDTRMTADVTLNRALTYLSARARLTDAEADGLARLAVTLATRWAGTMPRSVALAGPPGTGKSTLSGLIAHLLDGAGVSAETLGIDDYYYSGTERQRLAEQRHPLFAERGVPGTHDFEALLRDLAALRDPPKDGLLLRQFDKYRDERRPKTNWRRVKQRAEIVLLDGWCFGARPQTASQLSAPVNALEQDRDPDGHWRAAVNREVARYRAGLEPLVDEFWFLSPTDWEQVERWRWRQEQDMEIPRLPDFAAVQQFLAPFERWVRWMMADHPNWADAVIWFNEDHSPGPITTLREAT